VYGCPRIVYDLAGVISGNIKKLMYANVYTPYTLFKGLLSRRCYSLNIHVSSFYLSQAFKRYVVDEEYPHLSDVNPYTLIKPLYLHHLNTLHQSIHKEPIKSLR